MTDFRPIFIQLGLEQYIDVFENEGFEHWETILEITESDLDALKVKLGHRRVLQRQIAFSRSNRVGPPPLPQSPLEPSSASETKQIDQQDGLGTDSGPEPRKKRRYRRHPKTDENAPERPPSAYVVFSNRMREDLKAQHLSFTETAKRVGESWQALSLEEKGAFEQQASKAKDAYLKQLAAYKSTDMYRDYQDYLAEFKAKYGSNGARPKLEHELSTASSASGNEGNFVEPARHGTDAQRLVEAPDGEPRYGAGTSLSRPSSMSDFLTTKDSSLSLSPPAHSSVAHLSSTSQSQPANSPHERSMLTSAQHNLPQHPSPWLNPPSSSATGPIGHNPNLPKPRRKPPGLTNKVPSFRHEESSRSSITSSQSSISTAATSLSGIRAPEEDAKQKVVLPPLSEVTGISREGTGPEQRITTMADFVAITSGISPYSGHQTPRVDRQLQDDASWERTPWTGSDYFGGYKEPSTAPSGSRQSSDRSSPAEKPQGSKIATPVGRADPLSLLAQVAQRDPELR